MDIELMLKIGAVVLLMVGVVLFGKYVMPKLNKIRPVKK
jgi:hypothetical protein